MCDMIGIVELNLNFIQEIMSDLKNGQFLAAFLYNF